MKLEDNPEEISSVALLSPACIWCIITLFGGRSIRGADIQIFWDRGKVLVGEGEGNLLYIFTCYVFY